MVTRVCLLARGPSLARWSPCAAPPADLLIAVNGAGLLHLEHAHWVVAHDAEQVAALAAAIGDRDRPRLYASRHAWLVVGCRYPDLTDRDLGLRETDFSVIAALHLALRLVEGPIRIDAWGVDLAGDTYAPGSAAPAATPRVGDWARIRDQIDLLLAAHPRLHLHRAGLSP